ncbi:hypothetical protein UJ101_02486 [Flavobacteriaceae bacterium UJ101]|nr:hypothetical protein UJ101_02486 [Flavobacteriaceae bacterium UJ101]
MFSFFRKIFSSTGKEDVSIRDFLDFAKRKGVESELYELNLCENILDLKKEEREYKKLLVKRKRYNKAIVQVFEIILSNEDIKFDNPEHIEELMDYVKELKI